MRKFYIAVISLILLHLASACNHPKDSESRVWLHRANAIAKAQHFQYNYPGFEIDVHYNDSANAFLIKHDFDEYSTLTLDEWCAAVDNISNMGVWFDFKNLSAENRDAALNYLKDIRTKHHLQGKLYVESSMYSELPVFQEAGFKVSYYIPFFFPDEVDSAKYERFRNSIRNAIETGVNAISGYDFQYDFMKKEFPDHTKLIWTTSLDTVYHAQLVEKLNADRKVDVILIPNEQY